MRFFLGLLALAVGPLASATPVARQDNGGGNEKVAFVGYGAMGSEMGPHLVEAGYEVFAYDIREERNEIARGHGVTVGQSDADVANQASIILGIVMSADIPEAYLGSEGIMAGAQSGDIVIMCSTTSPEMLEKVRAGAPEGVIVVDAPIVGGVKYAREASVTWFVGTDDEAVYNRIAPVLDVLGTPRHVGENGAGVEYKLISNVAIMGAEVGLREALDLADVFNRPYNQSLEFISAGPMAAVVERATDTTNPRPLRQSAEDDDALLSAVKKPKKTLPLSLAARNRLWEAVDVNRPINFDPDFVDLTRKTTSREPYHEPPQEAQEAPAQQ